MKVVDLRLRVLLMWLLALPVQALAQDTNCVPFRASDMHALVVDAHDALLVGDVAKHHDLLRALQLHVPCFDAAVRSDDLAQFLYELAMVRFADGQPWQDIVTAALSAEPDFARTYGPAQVRAFTPPVAAGKLERPTLPGATLWIDGRPAPERFDLTGPHLLQIQRATGWSSLWVENGALPASWVPAPPVAPPVATTPVTPPPQSTHTASKADDAQPALRVVVDAGLAVAHGPAVSAGDAQEPATRLWLPIEVGLEVDAHHGWFRALGLVMPMLDGTQVYKVDDALHMSRIGGGGSISGGGRFGVGQVGALVGARVPSRLVVQAVGGVQVHRSGLGLELRAGVDVTTESAIEPAFDLLLVFAPKVWSKR